MIHKIITILCVIFTSFFIDAHVSVQVAAKETAKVSLLIGYMATHNQGLVTIVQQVKKNFTFTNQFNVAIQKFDRKPTKKEMTHLFEKGNSLIVFLTTTEDGKSLAWRLYEKGIDVCLIAGKKLQKPIVCRAAAHKISDELWKLATGQEGFFSTKIVYCKEVVTKKKKVKHICMSDYDGSHEELLVDVPTVHVAPRWNHDLNRPLIFYSMYTNENIRLMTVDMNKRRKIASNFEGVNMAPAFSLDGTKLVYCLSRGDGNCQLYYCEKGIFKRLTNNMGNNVSPSLSDDGKQVFFCSDFQTGKPQIYVCELQSGKIERITNGGYCASPQYSSKKNQLAYAKIVSGTLQLFIYDLTKKTHTQLTFDEGNKEEFSWSPCGNRLLFSVDLKGNSRIALFNLVTKNRRYLTPVGVNCSYPDWSPIYREFPQIETS